MGGVDAELRASWAKTVISACKRAPEPLRTRALDAIPEPLRATIRNAPKLGWLPAATMMQLVESIDAVAGDDAPSVWAAAMRIAIDAPLLRPLRSGAFSLFGRDPYKIINMTPHVWNLLTRKCGTCSCERIDNGARLRLGSLDPALTTSPAFVDTVAGAGVAMLEQCERTGTVERDVARLGEGLATIDLHW